MLDIKLLKKIIVFYFEGSFLMVLFLVEDILIDMIQLGMSIGKSPVSILPVKMSWDKFLLIDEIG
ncbi:hypothetical protein C8N25_104141 [Algoriphagus antarcticus]|uniref:Uncharacterized protein n=1 Tax=Algoriphagus antarcticus TaxID=238540 RepID=A0A3E0DZM6_9BACT|nr:hypothetical protein C8N25_104141 [Algoriphagus antarcticus]